MLYPIKFKPIFKEKIWGGKKLKTLLNKNISSNKTGESWEVSSVKNNLSVVNNGVFKGKNIQELIEKYKADFVGRDNYSKYGCYFPLLIKFIDANDDLSVQVHPDDVFAYKNHKEKGKNEMWYVVDAERDTNIIIGVNRNLTKKEYLEKVSTNNLKEILNYEKISAGDAFFIGAGKIHAILKGTLLAEIQQSSDLTYRIFDWNRKGLNGKFRELHTEIALNVVKLKKEDNYFIKYNKNSKKTEELVSNSFFTVNILQFEKNIHKNLDSIDSFVVYMCVEGFVTIKYKEQDFTLQKGETILIPACINNIVLNTKVRTKLLEIYIKY